MTTAIVIAIGFAIVIILGARLYAAQPRPTIRDQIAAENLRNLIDARIWRK